MSELLRGPQRNQARPQRGSAQCEVALLSPTNIAHRRPGPWPSDPWKGEEGTRARPCRPGGCSRVGPMRSLWPSAPSLLGGEHHPAWRATLRLLSDSPAGCQAPARSHLVPFPLLPSHPVSSLPPERWLGPGGCFCLPGADAPAQVSWCPDLPCTFYGRRECLRMGPVALGHVKQGVISQPGCLLFLGRRLEVPNKQGPEAARVVPPGASGDTSDIKTRAINLPSLEHESRFLGL